MEYRARPAQSRLLIGLLRWPVDHLSHGYDAPFDRDRQFCLTYLAEALARPGKQRDLDTATSTGIEAIDLAANLSSIRSIDRIRYLSRQLKPHAKIPAVRDFLERAKVFVEG